MKLGNQLKAPFEPGDLLMVKLPNGDRVIAEFRRMEDDNVIVRWGPRAGRLVARIPWWSGCYLVRPAIRGYPYERPIPWIAWLWYWLRYLPYRNARYWEALCQT